MEVATTITSRQASNLQCIVSRTSSLSQKIKATVNKSLTIARTAFRKFGEILNRYLLVRISDKVQF